MTKPQETISERARHYELCFIGDCPQHEHCLHWLAGCEAPTDRWVVNSINPHHPKTGTSECAYYQEGERVRHACGMMHFYDEMPGRMERNIRDRLIDRFSRTRYYQYRNGLRLIPPAHQDIIARICRDCGWQQEPRYDAWQDEYLW